MFRGGQPYTEFKNVNCKQGKFRLEGNPWGVEFVVDDTTITGNIKIDLKDSTGSMVVKGYHIEYGTTSIKCNGNVAAYGVGTSSVSITGLKTTSVILVNPATSAQVGNFVPFGATCQTAGKALIQYYVGVASAAITTVPINYVVLHPQTS